MSEGRKNGFSFPRSSNQVYSWAGQLLSLSLFYPCMIAFIAGNGDNNARDVAVILVALHAFIVLVSFGLWYFIESHDPAEESCWSKCLPNSERWTKLKYDRMHKKRIEGLDHFCEWLNTSIGRSNYLPFILLVSLGFIQFCLQFTLCMLLLVPWAKQARDAVSTEGDPKGVAFTCAVVILAIVSISILFMYSMLLFFHMYLGYLGISTYDYTIESSRAYRQRQKLEQTHNAASKQKSSSSSSGIADTDTDTELGLPTSEMVSKNGEQTLDS